jgi:hypothetical protein
MTTKPFNKIEDDSQTEVERLAAVVRRKALASIAKQKKLVKNLRGDLEKHGDPASAVLGLELFPARVRTLGGRVPRPGRGLRQWLGRGEHRGFRRRGG